jgi:hypothetical protein
VHGARLVAVAGLRAVRTDDQNGVWVITLDRPPVNAVDFEAIAELEKAVEVAADDPGCRAEDDLDPLVREWR